MNCPNCGNLNQVGSKFCIKCGSSLNDFVQPSQTVNANQQFIEQNQGIQTNIPGQNSPVNLTGEKNVMNSSGETLQINDISMMQNNTAASNNNSVSKFSFASYFMLILAVILKPFTAFKNELNKFNDFKNSAILSLIVSVIATLVNLISVMLNTVMVKSFSWSTGDYKTTWVWKNLKDLEYFKIIGKNFLIYLGIIVVIAGVYYIASLIVKKQTNFSRLLGISAIAVVPALVCSLVLSPILALIWDELAMPITVVGALYTFLLIYEGMNNEVLVEGDAKYYFNLVCFSILGIAAYYLYMKLFVSSISGGVDDILDLLG